MAKRRKKMDILSVLFGCAEIKEAYIDSQYETFINNNCCDEAMPFTEIKTMEEKLRFIEWLADELEDI